MGPSVSFPLPLRIAQKLPIRNCWEIISERYRIPLPIFYYFDLTREVLANTMYIFFSLASLLSWLNRHLIRRVKSTPDPDTFEKYRDTPSHFLSRDSCKSMPSSWQEIAYAPPICITIRLPFSRAKLYNPPPPPHFWPEGIFQGGGGGGVYFEAPRGRNFIRSPPSIHPPTPRRVFSGVGGRA